MAKKKFSIDKENLYQKIMPSSVTNQSTESVLTQIIAENDAAQPPVGAQELTVTLKQASPEIVAESVDVADPPLDESADVAAPAFDEPVEIAAPAFDELVDVAASDLDEPVDVAASTLDEPVDVAASTLDESANGAAPAFDELVNVADPDLDESADVVASAFDESVDVVDPVPNKAISLTEEIQSETVRANRPVNLLEKIVLAHIGKVLFANGACNCEKCRKDAAALTLNKIPPKYISPFSPSAALTDFYYKQHFAEIICAMNIAAEIVKVAPRH